MFHQINELMVLGMHSLTSYLRRNRSAPAVAGLTGLAVVATSFLSAQQRVLDESKMPRPGDRPAANIHSGRSVVMARHGMIATSQPLASAAGLRVMQEGGNAIDAAL